MTNDKKRSAYRAGSIVRPKRLKQISRTGVLRRAGMYARPECVLISDRELFVRVKALYSEQDPPSTYDRINAHLTAFIVSGQPRFLLKTRTVYVVLAYPNHRQVAETLDPGLVSDVLDWRKHSRNRTPLPTETIALLACKIAINRPLRRNEERFLEPIRIQIDEKLLLEAHSSEKQHPSQ